MSKSGGKSWLYGLITAMVLFMLFFIYLVTRIYQSDYSLVSENSYEQGLKHDQMMEVKKRSDALGIKFDYFGGNNTLKLQLPESLDSEQLKGNVYFYRPSTAKLDFNIPLKLTDSNAQFFNLEKIEKGIWKVKLTFKHQNEEYYQEYSFSR